MSALALSMPYINLGCHVGALFLGVHHDIASLSYVPTKWVRLFKDTIIKSISTLVIKLVPNFGVHLLLVQFEKLLPSPMFSHISVWTYLWLVAKPILFTKATISSFSVYFVSTPPLWNWSFFYSLIKVLKFLEDQIIKPVPWIKLLSFFFSPHLCLDLWNYLVPHSLCSRLCYLPTLSCPLFLLFCFLFSFFLLVMNYK